MVIQHVHFSTSSNDVQLFDRTLELICDYDLSFSPCPSACSRYLKAILMAIFASTLWLTGGTLGSLIITWTWLCGGLWKLGTTRFPKDKTSIEFYFSMLKWIQNAKSNGVDGQIVYSKQHDKMMRLCSFNSVMNKVFKKDDSRGVRKHFDNKSDELLALNEGSQYKNVTMAGLRIGSSFPDHARFLNKLWKVYARAWKGLRKDFGRCTKWGIIALSSTLNIYTFINVN